MQKISDRFTSGIPDYMGCYLGLFVCLELKAPKQRPTALQAATGRAILQADGIWVVVDNERSLRQWVLKIERIHFGLIKELRLSSAEIERSSDY